MRHWLLLFIFMLSFNVFAIDEDAAHNKALADSAALEAKDSYQEGIDAKLANRFEDARIIFGNLAEFPEAGTEQWSGLAADELKYGLLLHEANFWILKMGSVDASREPIDGYIRKAEERLRQIIELNADKLERISKAQLTLSQLAISKQAYKNSTSQNDRSKLSGLRVMLRLYFNDHGSWPKRSWLQTELRNSLEEQGAAKDLWYIIKYWQSGSGFYLILKNSTSGSTVKMKGNDKGGISQ